VHTALPDAVHQIDQQLPTRKAAEAGGVPHHLVAQSGCHNHGAARGDQLAATAARQLLRSPMFDHSNVERDVVTRVHEVSVCLLVLLLDVPRVVQTQVLLRQLVHQLSFPVLLSGGGNARHLVAGEAGHVVVYLVAGDTRGNPGVALSETSFSVAATVGVRESQPLLDADPVLVVHIVQLACALAVLARLSPRMGHVAPGALVPAHEAGLPLVPLLHQNTCLLIDSQRIFLR